MDTSEKQQRFVKTRPEQMPAPTYWPFFMAVGLLFAGWGLISTWVIAVAGLAIFIAALAAWINIIRHEK